LPQVPPVGDSTSAGSFRRCESVYPRLPPLKANTQLPSPAENGRRTRCRRTSSESSSPPCGPCTFRLPPFPLEPSFSNWGSSSRAHKPIYCLLLGVLLGEASPPPEKDFWPPGLSCFTLFINFLSPSGRSPPPQDRTPSPVLPVPAPLIGSAPRFAISSMKSPRTILSSLRFLPQLGSSFSPGSEEIPSFLHFAAPLFARPPWLSGCLQRFLWRWEEPSDSPRHSAFSFVPTLRSVNPFYILASEPPPL